MNKTEHLKDALQLFCSNVDCSARGKIGAGNLVSHGKKRERYTCKTGEKTFCARQGTMLVGLRTPEELMVIVVTLLAYGCPVQAIVHALGLMNGPWPGGKREPVPIVKRSMQIRSWRARWICCTCKPMRSEGKDGK